MTIDAATLPHTEAGATLVKDQLFTIRGSGFSSWPQEIVLSYGEGYISDSNEPNLFMVLDSRTQNELVFRVQGDYTYQQAHTWGIFGTPTLAPRSVLEYEEV